MHFLSFLCANLSFFMISRKKKPVRLSFSLFSHEKRAEVYKGFEAEIQQCSAKVLSQCPFDISYFS